MQLTDLETALIDRANALSVTRTPEMLAHRLGVSMLEVREAEKSALRKLANPGDIDPKTLDEIDLAPVEQAVLEYLYCEPDRATPEELARRFDVPLLTVLEAQKEAMRHVQEKTRRTDADAA